MDEEEQEREALEQAPFDAYAARRMAEREREQQPGRTGSGKPEHIFEHFGEERDDR